MIVPETSQGEFCDSLLEMRGVVLSIGGLVLRNFELAAGTIGQPDSGATAEVFDIHESVEDLAAKAEHLAERMVTNSFCDEYRLGLILSALETVRLLVRTSSRAVEIGTKASVAGTPTGAPAARLLHPYYSEVHSILRRSMVALADQSDEAAAAILGESRRLEDQGAELFRQLRELIRADRTDACSTLNLLLIQRLLQEAGRQALAICAELQPGSFRVLAVDRTASEVQPAEADTTP